MRLSGIMGKVSAIMLRTSSIVATIVAVLAASPATVSAYAWYSITELPLNWGLSPNDTPGYTAINNSGQVMGSGGAYGAALYSNGSIVDLGGLDNNSTAFGMNDLGQVVGFSGSGAALFSNGTVTQLGGFETEAFGINNSGQIVGSAGPHAALFSNGAVIDLAPMGGGSMAFSINDSGQAVGFSTWTNSTPNVRHAVLFSNGTVTDLGSLGDNSVAFSINSAGQAVGTSFIAGNPHATLFSGGAVTDLGTLVSGGISSANNLNNYGLSVGRASSADGGWHAALFRNGTVVDLNNLVNPTLGWTLIEANGINDAGQIVCGGMGKVNNTYHTLLLTPINPPAAPTNVTATADNGQATVTFMPPVDRGGSPITYFTVTANPGNISANGPSSPITVTGLTNNTIYTFSVTATNNDGPGPAATATNLDRVDVTLNGTGSGSVNSTPNGIHCTVGTCGNNFNPIVPINQVTLTPSVSNGSQFSGWVGICSGTGSCNVTLDPLYQSVTATFDIAPNAQIVGNPQNYGLLQSAYNDAPAVAVIQAKGVVFAEKLAFG
jgi:probable HAF family extracellular repeat protein